MMDDDEIKLLRRKTQKNTVDRNTLLVSHSQDLINDNKLNYLSNRNSTTNDKESGENSLLATGYFNKKI